MKKLTVIALMGLSLALLLCGCRSAADTDDAVRVGNVTVKGADLDAVWRMHAIAEGKTLSVQDAAREAAETALAEKELKGNEDIPSLEEFLKDAAAHYAEDKAENDAFCKAHGITSEQLNDAVARSKRSIQLHGAHYDFVIHEYRRTHTDPADTDSAEKLNAIYDAYVTEKLGGSTVVILDEKRVSALEENAKALTVAE